MRVIVDRKLVKVYQLDDEDDLGDLLESPALSAARISVSIGTEYEFSNGWIVVATWTPGQ